jgi:hypothetical protein
MGDILNAREQRRYCKAVDRAYLKLLEAPLIRLPASRRDIDAPETQGVYIIYGDYNRVLHVGKSARGKKGLLQRLKNHWDGKSSFVGSYLDRDATALRAGFKYRYLEIDDARSRALLEMYATAKLCPLHLGLNDRPKEE